MVKQLLRVCTIFMVFFLAAAQPAVAKDTPQRLAISEEDIQRSLGTDFYGIYLLGKKVGFAKVIHAPVLEGKQPGYVVKQDLVLRLTAMGRKHEMQVKESLEFEGKPDYALRSARFVESDGKAERTIHLSRNTTGFDAVVEAAGEKSTRTLAGLDYSLVDVLTPAKWLRESPPVGTRLVSRDLDLEELKIERETRKLLAVRTSMVNGVKLTYQEVEVVSSKADLTGLERFDPKANRLLSMKMMGIFEIRLEPEKQARDIGYSTDLFVLGTVKVDKPLGDYTRLSGLVLRAPALEGAKIPNGPRQHVEVVANGSIEIRLGQSHGRQVAATPEEIQESLADTPTYPIRNARVTTLARQAVGSAVQPREKLERLVRFVHDYITPSYAAEPLTLLDILKGRKGDCKAYAAMFTALARASGIPAREVAGLVYMGDDQRAFGGHAWNEVVLDGHWLPIDASANENEINPTHVSFGPSRSSGVNLFAGGGRMSFRLVKLEEKK